MTNFKQENPTITWTEEGGTGTIELKRVAAKIRVALDVAMAIGINDTMGDIIIDEDKDVDDEELKAQGILNGRQTLTICDSSSVTE